MVAAFLLFLKDQLLICHTALTTDKSESWVGASKDYRATHEPVLRAFRVTIEETMANYDLASKSAEAEARA